MVPEAVEEVDQGVVDSEPKGDPMSDLVYEEKLTSRTTTALFIALTISFLLLLLWRWTVSGVDALAVVFLCIFALFLFYSINYRTLIIRVTSENLIFKFGLFTWALPLDDISECHPDDTPIWLKYGGAGIHFGWVRGQYRAFFNFLEHPRLVLVLRKKRGPVQSISFSTKQPETLKKILSETTAQS